MEPEGLPGEDLEHLLHGSEAARKDEEGIGTLGHEGFASMHGVDDVEFGAAVIGDLFVDEDVRNDADDAAAAIDGCLRDGVHEADISATVDEADVAFGEGATEVNGSLLIDRITAGCAGAEDSDAADRHVLRLQRDHDTRINVRRPAVASAHFMKEALVNADSSSGEGLRDLGDEGSGFVRFGCCGGGDAGSWRES